MTLLCKRFLERLLNDNESLLKELEITAPSFREFLRNDALSSKQSESTTLIYLNLYDNPRFYSGFLVRDLIIPKETTEGYRSICIILRKLRRLKFLSCKFSCNTLDLGCERNAACCFEKCTFKKPFELSNGVALSNTSNAIFDRCHFECPIRVSGSLVVDDITSQDSAAAFSCCTFASDIEIYHATLDAPVFLNLEDNCRDIKKQINSLKIKASRINDRFILNHYDITAFDCVDTVFDCKVEMKNCHITTFSVLNTNFKQLADFYATEFKSFSLEKSILSDFVGFECCVFGNTYVPSNHGDWVEEERIARFRYVTFLSFANFRNARFNIALDLKNSNRKELPNFIGCKFLPEAEQTTDRETFRIIKHSFDAVGNHVEGNVFFAMEMGAYRREIKATKRYSERFLLWCNHALSDFGQSYIRPIFWLIGLAIVFYILRHGYRESWLYQIYPEWNDGINNVSMILNEWAVSFKVFSPLMFKGMEFLSLSFGIVFSVLIWLAVVSIRRHSKR